MALKDIIKNLFAFNQKDPKNKKEEGTIGTKEISEPNITSSSENEIKAEDLLALLCAKIQESEKLSQQRKVDYENGLSYSYNLTLTNNTTIRPIQEAFTEDYPYLRLGFFLVQTGEKAKKEGGAIEHISSDTSLGKVRSFKGTSKIRIGGSDTPEDLEKRFRKETGLVIKICYNDEAGERYYISNDSSEYKIPIYEINETFKNNGYETADIS